MLKNILRWCNVSNSGKDDKQFAAQQISFLGKTADAVVIYPYGVHANIPPGTLALVSSIQGHQANKSVIGVAPVNRPQLREGEVVIYHPKSGSTLTLRENGDIDIAPSSGVTNISGNVSVSGDLTVEGDTEVMDITSNSVNIGGDHVHTQAPDSNGDAQVNTGVPM